MFGGLELKGGSSKDADENPSPETAAPSPGLSSFGFMNVSAPEPAPAAPEVSSFSFMNSSSPAAAPASDQTPTPPVTSGFSFMMQEQTTVETTTEEAPAVIEETNDADGAQGVSSGFDFMNSMATPAPVVEDSIIPTIAEEVPVAPPVKSGFSFFSDTPALTPLGETPAPATEDNQGLPAAIHTRTNSVGSVSSALSNPSLPPVAPTTTTSSTPAKQGGVGMAGVTFGTSSAKPRIKKKKIRSSKIGVGGGHVSAESPAKPMPAPAPPPAPAEPKSARDAALEATKKAEAFMQSKAMEEARTAAAIATPPIDVYETSPEDLGLEPTASTDEILAAAQEAAEKAKMLEKGKSGGFMGTFFKGFRATSAGSTTGSIANGSKHSVNSNQSNTPSANVAQQRVGLPKQQQPAKTDDSDDDDDMVVVTTSVGGYKQEVPPAPEPSSYTPIEPVSAKPSSFTPVTVPTSTVPTRTFQPAVIPTYGNIPAKPAAPVATTRPKVRNTPKDKFEGHQEDFSQSVTAAMRAVEDARSARKGLLEERFVALAKDRFATREIEQLEELLQVAIDEEDYEQADELGQKLDAHKCEKSEVASMLASNQDALTKLDLQTSSLGDMVAACFEDLAAKLKDLKQTELETEKQDDHETLTQYASISKQLSEEHERLQQDLKRLEREEGFVEEERKELEDAINEQTGEIEIQKEEASENLKGIEAEIEELRRSLEVKQKEAADLRTKMFGFEDSISKVRVKFSRQLNRVHNKEMTVKQNRSEWEIENQQYQEQKEAHDLQVKAHSDTLLAHEELMKTLESELKLSRDFSEIIPKQMGFMEDSNDEGEGSSGDEVSLAQLKANVVKCEGGVETAKKALKLATQTIQNLESEKEGLVARIPQLETLKKSAAAGRDFKAAGKYSKEIKDATSRIQKCEEELSSDALANKKAAEEELTKLDSELLEAKKIADAKEKESGLKRMATLAKTIEQLLEEKKEKCGDASSDGNSVKCVGARVLEGQILILKAEGEELGMKYGGWTELTKSFDLGNAETDPAKGPTDAPTEEEELPKVKRTPEELKERLTRARELIAKCADLEEKIQAAADKDDYEAAGEYQEALDKVNSEIEEMNITDEECELLAEDETTVESSAPKEDEPKLSDEERLAKAKELIMKQSDLEEKIQDAAEREDFEAAEEFQTTLDNVTEALGMLNLTEEEIQQAGSPSPAEETPPSEDNNQAEEEGTEGVGDDCKEEEKKEIMEEETVEEETIPAQEDKMPADEKECTENEPVENEEGESPVSDEQIE